MIRKVKAILFMEVQSVENQGIVKSEKCHIPSPHLFTLFAEAISEKKTGEGKVKAKSGESFTLNLLILRS